MGRIARNVANLVLVVVVMGVSGCASTSSSTPSGSSSPPLLQRAHKSYLTGIREGGQGRSEQLKQARRYAETYLNRHPDGAHVAEAWYRIGQVEFHRQNYDNVIQATENGLEAVRRPVVRAALLMLNGKASAAGGNPRSALERFESAKELISSDSSAADWINKAELEYHHAGALVRTASFQRAKTIYQTLQNTYPDTEFGQRAKKKLPFFREFFSVQVGLFSEEDNAINMRRKLERDGMNAYILSAKSDGRMQYSVRTGKYDTFEEAKRMSQRLERQGIEAIVKP